MKTVPIVPAEPTRSADGLPFSEPFGDLYHPRAGAFTQARHVFIGGNRLPERWRQRDRFVVLETGFGLGNNFLATWQAWRDDPQRPRRLDFISIEQHPLRRHAMAHWHESSELRGLAQVLVAQWPALTHGLHTLNFDAGAVRLLLGFGDVATWLPEIVARVDAFYLDGFAPDRNPQMWQPRMFKAVARMAAPGATVATWTAARAVREGLTATGMRVELAPGTGGKRDITLGRFEPAFVPRRGPSRQAEAAPESERHALIIGAGLAGCATAWALAGQGWRSTLIDRRAAPAQETSGNPAGLFHDVVHAQDGVHARWYRAAAAEAHKAVRHALDAGDATGSAAGLLRLETAQQGLDPMRGVLQSLGLPDELVQVFDIEAASAAAGVRLPSPAWFHAMGGWVDPAGLSRSFVRRAGSACTWSPATAVAHVCRTRGRWQATDAAGHVLAEAPNLVLAGGGESLGLMDGHGLALERVRGQISVLDTAAAADCGLARLTLPVSGRGYAIRLADSRVLFGATSQVDDGDPSVRGADHLLNLAQLERLIGISVPADAESLNGRTAWRWNTRDRLPLIGALPDLEAMSPGGGALRNDQPRFVPRLPGAYVFTALGSRGITSAALGAQVLAALMTGAPCPVESSLLDAVDPARFVSRSARRSESPPIG